ncbi:MAG: hypothetical protein EO766_12030 [Hydrotalea sp. AMD]|uniref:hypothetical protein n=1 Tax=Hydrotalea sp. AMD TaxID=2501297 RepID=UPI001024E698|nr:hypothetical protein [Hydrotalea sp. AMD]RWZ87247.1 MAG: hypothetical protein EO766_12030 [Hydrotalea sp. AMD]
MSGPAKENELSRKSKNMTGKIPSQYTNTDFGKKRKAKFHKFNVRSTGTGKLYWSPAIAESCTFSEFLINEASDIKLLDKMTVLPDMVISELQKLINQGARDLNQNWMNAAELVNTAFHISNIRRPNPDQKGAWKQYTELLGYGVNALHKARGPKGSWRASDAVYGEGIDYNPMYQLTEQSATMGGHRFFVKIPGAMDVEIDASDMSEVLRELINKLRRHGAQAEVTHRTQEGAVLTVMKQGEPVEEIIVQDIS